ncbi:uncharacterized protein LOC115396247 isoform X2 [Salarias fasciatus]|uniref:uncharacterized protein LOC115383295 isoform X2 n=1 Tax=Salarias fasciatus TaxID=181472 RepID=UPI0011767FB0|nr:uncharacterized protein LOC115383295 isoform X2 [Salarias fasciatus]XP_029957860.1 uncharacterized protein LOC115396247 isoform X2 [Salarias fasciatus]
MSKFRTYLVECRVANGKKPANGWQVEPAVVLQLAEKESTLRSAERELLKVDKPKHDKRPRKPKRLFHEEDDEETAPIPKKKPKLAAQRRADEEILSEDNQLRPVQNPGESSSMENADQIRVLQNQVRALQKENTRLRNMVVKEIPTLLMEMKNVLANRSPMDLRQVEGEGETTPCKPSEVKLGNDGTTTVSAHCWETARAQPTANGMARVLLMGLFSVDVLLKSNLTGGLNKIDPTAERRQALDGKKLQALLDAVVNHHPGTKLSDLRKSINTRICELRHQVKQKNMSNVK